jgi:carbon storage regulator
MLVLSRRPGESITIGNDVVVTIISIAGGQVRLGISAPRNVQILREEVFTVMQEENRAAADGLSHMQQLDEVQTHLQGKK